MEEVQVRSALLHQVIEQASRCGYDLSVWNSGNWPVKQ